MHSLADGYTAISFLHNNLNFIIGDNMEQNDLQSKQKKIKKGKGFRLYNQKWVILITVWTFFLASGLGFISEVVLRNVSVLIAFIILIFIVLIGIFFDLIGIAVATAREKPFHSMAANRIKGSKHAIILIKNAGPVSNFCNDVIGDICGIISGAAGAIIILQIISMGGINTPLYGIVLSGFVAAVTVGGKAVAKEIALRQSKEIVFTVGKIFYYIDIHIGLNILAKAKSKKAHLKTGK